MNKSMTNIADTRKALAKWLRGQTDPNIRASGTQVLLHLRLIETRGETVERRSYLVAAVALLRFNVNHIPC